MITAGLLVLIALLICIVTQLDGRASSDEAQIYALFKEVERLTKELEKFDDCLDYIEEFLKKTLCKNGCDECPLNHPTEQFPHVHCRFYELIEDVAYIEDHIDLKEKEQEHE